MSLPYIHDESPHESIAPFGDLLHRRSSVSSGLGGLSALTSTGTSSAPRSPTAPLPPGFGAAQLRQPFVSHLVYNEKTGEIALPPSPPLLASWKETSSIKHYADEKISPTTSRFHLHAYGTPIRATAPKGRAFQLPRPWLSVIGLASVTLSFIVLLSYLVPSSTPYTVGAASALFHRHAKCEPYSSFGTMNVDLHDADANQWVPFDQKCRPPGFFAQLRDERTTTDFSWLHNRTALVIGDQISREHVENFCSLLGEDSEVIREHHKYHPAAPAFRMPSKSDQLGDRPNRLAARSIAGSRSLRETSRPRMCYIPKYDFLLISVFHFGLDQEDFWRDAGAPQFTAPGMFEHRLMDVVQPIVAALRADGRRSAPDYVEVASGVWDLARWAQQDIGAQQQTTGALLPDRVTWYRFRVGQVLEKVRKMFPEAKAKTWRTLHYPLDQTAERDYFFDKITPRVQAVSAVPEPPYFSHTRINQLDQAVRSLVLPSQIDNVTVQAPHPDFRLNEWGRMLKGFEAHQRDRLHGDPLPGGYLWGDVMLYELWRGVVQSERLPLRKFANMGA